MKQAKHVGFDCLDGRGILLGQHLGDLLHASFAVAKLQDLDGGLVRSQNPLRRQQDPSVTPRVVAEKTVDLARGLSLPEKEIKKWVVAQDELYSERDRRIKSALSKLERNPNGPDDVRPHSLSMPTSRG